jgi:hypothetical protein
LYLVQSFKLNPKSLGMDGRTQGRTAIVTFRVCADHTTTILPHIPLKPHPSLPRALPPSFRNGHTHACDVPFLFTILSIGKALLLQAHPNKDLGAALTKRNPTESNRVHLHEPQARDCCRHCGRSGPVAFTGFCGLRPLERIVRSLRNMHELHKAIADDEAVDTFLASPTKEGLR